MVENRNGGWLGRVLVSGAMRLTARRLKPVGSVTARQLRQRGPSVRGAGSLFRHAAAGDVTGSLRRHGTRFQAQNQRPERGNN